VDLSDAKKNTRGDVVKTMLQGQASGVSLVSSASPAQAPVIPNKGHNSLGTQYPDWLRGDGVPTQKLSDLNPKDVVNRR